MPAQAGKSGGSAAGTSSNAGASSNVAGQPPTSGAGGDVGAGEGGGAGSDRNCPEVGERDVELSPKPESSR